jgi:hypothetical protein
LKTQLQNPKVLSRSETPVELASFGAAWKSDEAVGTVRIVPPGPDLKGIDVAAAVTALDAQSCKDKFASGRVTDRIDSDVIFRGFSSCDDSDGGRTVEHFIVPRTQGGGFIVFSISSSVGFYEASNFPGVARVL